MSAAGRLSTYTRCKACSALMLWVVTLGGKRMPLDPKPDPAGTVVVMHLPDGTVRGRVLTGEELPAVVEAHRPHDRTCPATARTPEETGPKCSACRSILDEWLVGQGYTRHIGCLSAPVQRAPARPPVALEPVVEPEPTHEQAELFDLGGGAR